MGDLFEPAAAPSTGRAGDSWDAEQRHRYLLARALCGGRDVLDLSTGDGAGLLAEVARSVIACDIDPTNMTALRRPGLDVVAADARELPFASASVDVLVCFEALGRFAEHDVLLSEIRRVLRFGGLLVVGGADRAVASADPLSPHALTREELVALVGGRFAHVAVARQQAVAGSIMLPEGAGGTRLVFERHGEAGFAAAADLRGAPYMLCLASDQPLPALPVSLLVLHEELDAGHGTAAPQQAALDEIGATLAALAQRIEDGEETISELTTRLETALSEGAALIEARDAAVAEAVGRMAERDAAVAETALRTEEREAARAEIAQRIKERDAATAETITRTAERDAAVAETALRTEERDTARAEIAQRIKERDAAEAKAALLTDERDAARVETQTISATLQQTADQLARISRQLARVRAAHEQAQGELQRLNATLATTRTRELATEDRLAAIEHSRTWQATGWLRRFGGNHPTLARQVRRTMLIAEWTTRGELGVRLGAWRRRAPMLALPAPQPATAIVPPGLVLPASDVPLVSVIIPCFGRTDVTVRCLAALAAAPPRCALEVLVAEDASGDPAVAALADIPGVRLLQNAENLGFLRNCNVAALQAHGQYLLFLNNDTEVQPGAVDAMVELARLRPDAGLVGAKLLYPDGRLQEAGGVIWADGSGWNVGHDSNPAAPEFNYVREVDYCSAAALLVPAALFAELGGFDEAFVPAYCEDSDLAFRVRSAGLKVLYQPRAVVVHHEGVSHGSDTTAGVKAHQVGNRQILRERWAEVLRAEHFAPDTELLRARDRARGRPVCLVIDHYVPEPDRDAGSRTMTGFVQTLQEANGVVKFWPENQAAREPYTEALRQQGVEVICGPPPIAFSRWIAANGASLDHVLLSRPTMAPAFLPLLARHAPQAAISFYGHDLHSVRMRREATLSGEAALVAAAEAMERTERTVWLAADAVLYPSEVEAETVRRLEPSVRVCTVTPYRHPVWPPREGPATGVELLFVAGFAHMPNLDAADWLVREILPLLHALVPGVRLALVGSNPTDAVLSLAGKGVEVTGFIPEPELQRRYRSARAAVVPLRVGAGVKAKVVEALCAGLPLVTTTIGAEGLPNLDAVAAVADTPATIAAALARLLHDDIAWLAASHAQSRYAASNFAPERMRTSLLDAMAAAAEVRETRSPRA